MYLDPDKDQNFAILIWGIRMRSKLYSYVVLASFFSINILFFQNCGSQLKSDLELQVSAVKDRSIASIFTESKVSPIDETSELSFGGNGHNTTWDGRLVIFTQADGWRVTVFRPERVSAVQGQSVNLGYQGANGAMSEHIVALKPSSENGYGYTVDSNNKRSIFYQFNALTFAPASGDPAANNPFPSDANGNPSASAGYETYDLYIYTQHYGDPKWLPLGGLHNPEAQSILQKHENRVLGRMRMKVVIQYPKTKNAKPIKTILVDDFQPIKTNSNNAIRGIEPSVTTDGKLMIFNENGIYSGYDSVMYIYNENPSSLSGWSSPKPISSLYTESEFFKARYPIARTPLKSNLGELFTAGEHVLGAYPWISWEGTEITFMAMHANSPTAPARRAGFSVVGRWTGNKIRHVDGSFNKDDTIGTKKVRLFTSALGSTSSIWNPFKEFVKPTLPYQFENPSLFLISSNTGEFSEIGFRDFVDGRYVLSLPMNPSMRKLSNLTNISQADEADFYQTPDLSMNDLNGRLLGGAHFPLGTVPGENGRMVTDTIKSVGFRGQGIQFPETGSVVVSSKPILAETKFGFTAELFVKPISEISQYQYLLNKPNSYSIILEKDRKLSFRVFIKGSEKVLGFVGSSLALNEWTHVAMTHDPESGYVKAFINGKLVAEKEFEKDFISHNDSNNLIIGPGQQTSSGGSVILILDEVKISNVARSSVEIADSAGIPYADREIRQNVSESLSLATIFSKNNFRYPQEFQLSQKKAQLGAMLFSDQRLSSNGKVSCATCHATNQQLSDGLEKSIGVKGVALRRHSPVAFNRLLGSTQMWDGRFNSLLTQAAGPITHPEEMGLASVDEAVNKIKNIPGYLSLFNEAFGKDVDAESLKLALASFQATMVTQNSRADQYALGQLNVLTESEKNGRELFFGKARCAACHSGVNYTDEQFHNTGFFSTETDLGRQEITNRIFDNRSFKTPSLRNVSLTAPYMHNGSIATLRDVVNFYITGGLADNLRDPEIKQLNLSYQEITDLVAFLNTLNSEVKPILNINVNPTLPESCKSNQTVQNGQCVDLPPQICIPQSVKSCSVQNGDGEQICLSNGSGYGLCKVKTCHSGYSLSAAGICVVTIDPLEPFREIVRKLFREILKREVEPSGLKHYTTYLVNGGTEAGLKVILQNSDEGICKQSGGSFVSGKCVCTSGSISQSGRCVPQPVQICSPNTVRSCPVTNGIGQQTCDSTGSGYGACTVKNCNSGFILSSFGVCTAIVDPLEAFRNKVRSLYKEILKREADSSGLQTYTNYLVNGGTEAGLRTILQNSPEGKCVAANGLFSSGQCVCSDGREFVGGQCVKLSVEFTALQFDLYQNKFIELENVIIYMQADGNFVVYNKNKMISLWNIERTGYKCDTVNPCHMVFQNDGNLVAYQGNTVIWASGSMGGKKLIFQNSRPYLKILNSSNSEIWSSGY